MKTMLSFIIIGIVLLAGLGVSQIVNQPPNIPNGFTLNVPPLPNANGQLLRGFCDYTGSLQVENITVWNNYAKSVGQFQVEYSFKIRQPKCVMGFVGNVSYNALGNPISAMQQDFENQILSSIALPPPPLTPLANGNPGSVTAP